MRVSVRHAAGSVAGGDQRPAAGRGQRAQGGVALLGLVAVDRAAGGTVLGQRQDLVEDAGPGEQPARARVEARRQRRRCCPGGAAPAARRPARGASARRRAGSAGWSPRPARWSARPRPRRSADLERRVPNGRHRMDPPQHGLERPRPEPEVCGAPRGPGPKPTATTASPASSAAPVNSPGPGSPRGSPGAGSTSRISSGCSLANAGRRGAQRHVGPRAGGVGDEVLLVAGDLVGQLVEGHETGPPGAHPGHEPGGPARRERRRTCCGGHASKGTCQAAVACLGRSVGTGVSTADRS